MRRINEAVGARVYKTYRIYRKPWRTCWGLRMLRTERSQIGLFVVVALVLRVGLYLAFPGRVHADETFQYIEQANRLLGQPGIVPWEYVMGVRSWALPAIVAGVLWLARRLSADPLFSIEMVSVAFAVLSLVGVVLGYRLGDAKGGRAAAIACACINATSMELVYFAPHPLPDTMAAPCCSAVCSWPEVRPGRGLPAALRHGRPAVRVLPGCSGCNSRRRLLVGVLLAGGDGRTSGWSRSSSASPCRWRFPACWTGRPGDGLSSPYGCTSG